MIIPLDYTLPTERLTLRAPTREDFPHILSATRVAGFNDGMLWEPPSAVEELEAPLSRAVSAWQNNEAFQFTVTRSANQEFLGRISIRKTDIEDTWNVGFWTHPNHQNQGVMTEALSAVLRFGFLQLNAETVTACYAVWNQGSKRVLEKCNFDYVRYIEKGFIKEGKWVAENEMQLSRKKWQSSRMKKK